MQGAGALHMHYCRKRCFDTWVFSGTGSAFSGIIILYFCLSTAPVPAETRGLAGSCGKRHPGPVSMGFWPGCNWFLERSDTVPEGGVDVSDPRKGVDYLTGLSDLFVFLMRC
jgi:hypothetical protein